MLSPLFSPKSIALVGASKNTENVGGSILKNLTSGGYKKPIYPVNPKYKKIGRYTCYPSLLDIPNKRVDLVIIATPAKIVPHILEQAAQKKAKAAIVISAGFAEEDKTGKKQQEKIVAIAKQHDIQILGPNCLGIVNTKAKLNASFAAEMPLSGPVALFSQSGAFCTALIDWAGQRGLGLSKIISMGNEADLNETDFIEYLGKDQQTKVIAGYIKSITDQKNFLKIAKAVAKKKPIIILKGGPKKDKEIKPKLHRAGVIRVKASRELFQFSLTFAECPLPKGPRISIITNGGGPATLAANEAKKRRLKPHQINDLIGDATPERYQKALIEISEDKKTDMVLVLLTPQGMSDPDEVAHLITKAKKSLKKPLLVSFMGGDDVLPGLKILQKHRIPTFSFPEEAIKAAAALWNYRKSR